MRNCLYNCHIRHDRFSPVKYGFNSRIFMWFLDLDSLGEWDEALPLFSHNRSNIYEFRDSDHLYLGKDSLKANAQEFLRTSGISRPVEKVWILTNCRTMGYVFNPVSFLFCFGPEGEPVATIAEVHNTYGELKPFLVPPDEGKKDFRARHPKHFYISPFSHLDHQLAIRSTFPGETLELSVTNFPNDDRRAFFRATLKGERKSLTNNTLAFYSIRFPLVTVKVIAAIHFHALRLYLKKTPLFGKSLSPELQQGILPKNYQRTYE